MYSNAHRTHLCFESRSHVVLSVPDLVDTAWLATNVNEHVQANSMAVISFPVLMWPTEPCLVQGHTPSVTHSKTSLKKLGHWRMAGQGLQQSGTQASMSTPWASGLSPANGMITSAMLGSRLLMNCPLALLDTTSTLAPGLKI